MILPNAMTSSLRIVSVACVVLPAVVIVSGCSTGPKRPKHAPFSEVSPAVIQEAIAAQEAAARAMRPPQTELPPAIVLPGTYRPVLADGRMVLRRETDPKLIQGNYAVVVADPARGEIAHQPGLIEAELAREVMLLKQAQASQTAMSGELIAGISVVTDQATAIGNQASAVTQELTSSREANALLADEVRRLRTEAAARATTPAPATSGK
jgi:hypothetical protein